MISAECEAAFVQVGKAGICRRISGSFGQKKTENPAYGESEGISQTVRPTQRAGHAVDIWEYKRRRAAYDHIGIYEAE